MMPRILHLTTDEKFIDGIHYLFEKAFPKKNEFLVILPPGNPRLRFIKNMNNLKTLINSPDLIKNLEDECGQADLVVFHGMNLMWANLINKAKSTFNFMYVVWGAEIYLNPLLYKNNLYGPLTHELKIKLNNSFNFVERLKKVYRSFRYRSLMKEDIQKEFRIVKDALKRIPRIGVPFKEEFDLYKEFDIISDTAVLQKLAYYPLEFIVKNIDISKKPGDNIWIGNSSAFSNNHLESLEILSKFKIQNRKIMVPLSYGPKKSIKHIKLKGESLFGQNFKPLTTFLPLKQYNELIQSCGIVIMNQYRQQAVGNILAAVYIGSKVFLNENNTIYHFLKRIGCYVFSIQNDLEKANHDITMLDNLSENQIKNNQLILKNEFGEKILINELHKGIGSLLNSNS